MKTSSKCESCGEEILETGNYEFKVIKAKRIPKKARKLIKQTEGSSNFENHSALSQTKFGRFLLSRARPKNIIEITCGNCSTSNKIVIKKHLKKFSNSSLATPLMRTSQLWQIDLTGSKKKKKKKNKKDLTAGLCIPLSLNSSMPSRQCNRNWTAIDASDTPKPVSASSSLSSVSDQISKVSKFMTTQTKAMKATADKQKEMDKLKKVLFKSKQNPPNSGASLKDFLSSK